jgi:hypothetical protein
MASTFRRQKKKINVFFFYIFLQLEHCLRGKFKESSVSEKNSRIKQKKTKIAKFTIILQRIFLFLYFLFMKYRIRSSLDEFRHFAHH